MMKTLLPAALACLLPFAANALSITNLDSKPHRVGIGSVGGSERVETIEPNRTIYLQETRMRLVGLDAPKPSVIRANNDEEYVIWGNGELQLQRYNSQTTRGMK